jgi:hypothetical protein
MTQAHEAQDVGELEARLGAALRAGLRAETHR